MFLHPKRQKEGGLGSDVSVVGCVYELHICICVQCLLRIGTVGLRMYYKQLLCVREQAGAREKTLGCVWRHLGNIFVITVCAKRSMW